VTHRAILGDPLQQEWVAHINENQWPTWARLCSQEIKIKYKEITQKETQLAEESKKLEKRAQTIWTERSEVHDWCQKQMTQTVEKKNMALYECEKAFNTIKLAQEIRSTVENKNQLLEKQINQLQKELKHAREKAKRLVKKSKV
jgi:chromosome segregation ATPase